MFKVMSVKIEARNVNDVVSFQYNIHLYNDQLPEGEREQLFQGEVPDMDGIEALFTNEVSPAAEKMQLTGFEMSWQDSETGV